MKSKHTIHICSSVLNPSSSTLFPLNKRSSVFKCLLRSWMQMEAFPLSAPSFSSVWTSIFVDIYPNTIRRNLSASSALVWNLRYLRKRCAGGSTMKNLLRSLSPASSNCLYKNQLNAKHTWLLRSTARWIRFHTRPEESLRMVPKTQLNRRKTL